MLRSGRSRIAAPAIAATCLMLLASCSNRRAPQTRATQSAEALLVVISFDGFRWDYPEIHGAPTLLALAREGVRAASLVPSFPSKTYPNHYTLAAGLRPEHHGIVANTMWDPLWNARFSLADRSAVEDGRWWEGEPIWVTAERAGVPTAASFWPGTEAAIAGVRPSIWRRYDAAAVDGDRVDEALGWLDRPSGERPRLLLLYFDEPDGAGHRFGPSSVQTREAVAHVDAILARLRAGIERRGLDGSTNWIVVSDHGMTDTDPAQTIVLEDHLDLAKVEIDDTNVVAQIRPRPDRENEVLAALESAHPHLHARRKSEVPESLHFRAHRRIPPIVVWVDPGWSLYATHTDREKASTDFPAGMHGYDPAETDMHGLFVAAGPAFRRGARGPAVDNVDLYELFCSILELPCAPNDGIASATHWALSSR